MAVARASGPPGAQRTPAACGDCLRRPPPYAALHVAWLYAEPLASVLRALKFGRLDYLGARLAGELAAILPRPDPEEEGPELVAPVPLHWRRRWLRGFDQAALVARALADELGLPYAEALRRRRATRAQSGLERSARLVNLRGAFAPRRGAGGAAVSGRQVLLVDDVVTTGATLAAAAEALASAGAASVVAAAVARTPEEG